jgi:hypothetical protein
MVCAQGPYGIVHLAKDALLPGGRRKDKPPGIGTRQQILAQDGLPARGEPRCWNFRYRGQCLLTLTASPLHGTHSVP